MLWLLTLALVVLLVVGVVAYLLSRRDTTQEEAVEVPSDCCGAHEVCERDSLLSKTNEVVYFDDEELDALSGRNAEEYTEQEIRQIEDVFFSMRESDVAGWLRSLQLRNIALPDDLKDQALLIVRERRHLI